MRTALGALGIAAIGYGGWLLVGSQDLDAVGWVVVWAATGVVLHDAVLAPVVLLLGWGAGRRRLPGPVLAGGTVLVVLLGTITLAAVPVLGGFGADPTNSTLLARDYLRGWLLVAAGAVLVAAVVGLAGLRSEADGGRRAGGSRPRRR